MKAVYYNDSEPFVCDWLENLIREKLLPDGVVDRRPIQEVEPKDVQEFTQCHFFAGIGGWAYALGLGGWPATRPVWTGSCPCQDLSAAGKQAGGEGARHLWPEWYRLIAECRPPTVFGEQVASKLGRYWLTAVRLDLEELGYAVGGADLCAASVGAPHIRQRLWFVGDTTAARRDGGTAQRSQRDGAELARPSAGSGDGVVADTDSAGRGELRGAVSVAPKQQATERGGALGDVAHAPDGDGWTGERGAEAGARADGERRGRPASGRIDGVVGESIGAGLEGHAGHGDNGDEPGREPTKPGRSVAAPGTARELADRAGARQLRAEPAIPDREDGVGRIGRAANAIAGRANGILADADGGDASAEWLQRGGQHGLRAQDSGAGFWSDCEFIPCRDGKARPVEPGTFPLAHGIPARMGRLRGYGNAINPWTAAAFVTAYLDVRALGVGAGLEAEPKT